MSSASVVYFLEYYIYSEDLHRHFIKSSSRLKNGAFHSHRDHNNRQELINYMVSPVLPPPLRLRPFRRNRNMYIIEIRSRFALVSRRSFYRTCIGSAEEVLSPFQVRCRSLPNAVNLFVPDVFIDMASTSFHFLWSCSRRHFVGQLTESVLGIS